MFDNQFGIQNMKTRHVPKLSHVVVFVTMLILGNNSLPYIIQVNDIKKNILFTLIFILSINLAHFLFYKYLAAAIDKNQMFQINKNKYFRYVNSLFFKIFASIIITGVLVAFYFHSLTFGNFYETLLPLLRIFLVFNIIHISTYYITLPLKYSKVG